MDCNWVKDKEQIDIQSFASEEFEHILTFNRV